MGSHYRSSHYKFWNKIIPANPNNSTAQHYASQQENSGKQEECSLEAAQQSVKRPS